LDPKGQQAESYVPAPDAVPSQEKPNEKKDVEEDLGPAFPSEAGAMDDAPF
jgi:single-strand DNA-binding protein